MPETDPRKDIARDQDTHYTQLHDLDVEHWNAQHKEISLTLRVMTRILVITCVFCLITISGSSDFALLSSKTNVPLPFGAGQVPFAGFLIAGPLLMISLLVYSHIFLGMHHKLETNLPADDGGKLYRLPYILNSGGIFSRTLCFFIFYLLVPITILVFSARTTSGNPSHHYIANTFASLVVIGLFVAHFKRHRNQKSQWNLVLHQTYIALLLLPVVYFVFQDPTLDLRSNSNALPLWPIDIEFTKDNDRVLNGANLNSFKLNHANLSGADLSGAFLNLAYLKGAKLGKANLKGATLRSAKIACADLSYANINNADLVGAKVFATDFRYANFRGANLEDANFYAAVDKSACAFSGLEKASFVGANLEEADLTRAKFIKVLFGETHFKNANLHKTKILGSSVTASYFGGKVNIKTMLARADLRCSRFNGSRMEGVNLRKAKLGGTNFNFVDLANADLRGVDFSRTNCSDTCIGNYIDDRDCDDKEEDKIPARLVNTNLRFASLQESMLAGADLTDADLRGANLEGADISGAKLEKTNLLLANLSSTTGLNCGQLEKAKYWKASLRDEKLACGQEALNFRDLIEDSISGDTKAFDDLSVTLELFVKKYSRIPREKIGGKEIYKMTEAALMSGINLRRTNLDDIWLERADLMRAQLAGARFRRANFKGASLKGADLRGTDFRGANLSGAEMHNSLLRSAKFEGARLGGAIMKKADLDGANLIGALGLTCEQLTSAKNWRLSHRDEDLLCGADGLPVRPMSE